MNRPQPISAALVRSRWGRAALHVVCLIRRGPRRWHLRGIVRELFGSRRSHSGQAGRRLCAFLLCALLGGGFPVFAFAGSPALTFLPAVQVDGSGIYLHQVASTSLAVPISQTIRLADAPAFGQAASLSREPLDESALKNASLELVEAVPASQPLLARAVRMLRGQMGFVRNGAPNISLKVEALTDGLPGQTVRVRNPKTKREFYAKVQDQQVVVINL